MDGILEIFVVFSCPPCMQLCSACVINLTTKANTKWIMIMIATTNQKQTNQKQVTEVFVVSSSSMFISCGDGGRAKGRYQEIGE